MRRFLLAVACIGLSAPQAAQDSLYFLPADRVAVRVMSEVPAIELAPGVRVRTVVGATGSFSIGDFDGGAAAVLHHHTREQADVGLTGVFDMTIGNRIEALGAGAAVIVPPNVAHSIANRPGGVSTLIEFHTVRRPDLVPPRPPVTFPASPEPVGVPDGRPLVVQFDGREPASSGVLRTIQGRTCTLTWRRLPRGAVRTDVHPARTRAELFVYVVQGVAEVSAAEGVHRVSAGSLIVIPGGERHVTMRAVGQTDVALVEFSPERR